ncbi:hypothetical protein Cgig2_020482 [Carnegiea gigantea]|uniref:Uncharacterized protein n=1 Tax=Carnegiea gigantea TaxID=171969 RepID=A0A9Q1QHV7_9CARY|nr:hypothetical protein Cgig2_020482 [Carnegiea gigantea]
MVNTRERNVSIGEQEARRGEGNGVYTRGPGTTGSPIVISCKGATTNLLSRTPKRMGVNLTPQGKARITASEARPRPPHATGVSKRGRPRVHTLNSTTVRVEEGGERVHMPHQIERAYCLATNDRMAVTYLHGGIMNPNRSANDIILQGGETSQEETIMVWNDRGPRNKYFLCEFRIHKPQLVALLKTHISEERADDQSSRVSGGIWILWDSQDIDIETIQSQEQFITLWVTNGRQMCWLFTIDNASPHQQEREAFWADIQ